MTPCEKLGYKVGDRFIAQKDGNTTKRGDILTLREDDGSRVPLFQNESTQEATYGYIQKYDDMWPEGVWVLPETPKPPTSKDPIEYLKSAHADGDFINPETMLRECYGITKTERAVVEWSDATKRGIKVGDKVRIVGPASYTDQSAFMGQVKEVMGLGEDETGTIYDIGPVKGGYSFYFPASSVELI